MAVIERRRSPRGVPRSFYFINCFLYIKGGEIMAVKYVFVTGGVVSGLGKELPQLPWEDC